MFKNFIKPAEEKTSPTVIGAGCRIVGDIRINNHTVQIHGIVDGNVSASTVIIGRDGVVIGKVNAKKLFLHGTIEGPATVEIAHVFNNAQMVGTLSYYTLNITGNNGLECKLTKRKEKR